MKLKKFNELNSSNNNIFKNIKLVNVLNLIENIQNSNDLKSELELLSDEFKGDNCPYISDYIGSDLEETLPILFYEMINNGFKNGEEIIFDITGILEHLELVYFKN